MICYLFQTVLLFGTSFIDLPFNSLLIYNKLFYDLIFFYDLYFLDLVILLSIDKVYISEER